MPGADGLEVLRAAKASDPSIEVVLMTGYASVQSAVDAIRAGAFDYLPKPFDPDEAVLRIDRAAERKALKARAANLEAALGDKLRHGDLYGRSPAMQSVFVLLDKAAQRDLTVLLLGESGTGKELAARAIHRHSPRRDGPFVAVDCTALTEALLESELFGHVRGAFTGAVTDAPGLFLEAHGGTIFLDEIGDIGLPLQAKLLRVLQERQVRPVGGTQWRAVDVRVVAATNRDLAAAVTAGQFREDLYYRLNVVALHLPPLRERRDDVPLLVEHLVQRAAVQCGKPVAGVSAAALAALCAYDWPGNVRELAHALERSVALARDSVLDVEDLPAVIRGARSQPVADLAADLPTLEQLKHRYIQHVVELHGGNVSRAAAVLGIERRSLYRMLRRYGIAHRVTEE